MGFPLGNRARVRPPAVRGSEGYDLVNTFLFLVLTGSFRRVRVGVGRLVRNSRVWSLPIGRILARR
jgi:hypothetical protein